MRLGRFTGKGGVRRGERPFCIAAEVAGLRWKFPVITEELRRPGVDWLQAWPVRVAMETIEVSGTQRRVKADNADLSGSSFTDVDLSGATFRNVNFAGASFEGANLSGWALRNANLSGVRISHADLRGVSIADSLTAGMTIDGIAVTDLLAAYRVLTGKAE